MKIIHQLLLVCILFTMSIHAQSIERQVVASGGNTISNGTTTLDFTVGELVVTTITDGTTTLTQGFQQGGIKLGIEVNPIVFLQGALLDPNVGEENLMRDDLRVGSYIPSTSPYGDGLMIQSGVLAETGNNAIVDWVFVELRDAMTNTTVIASQSALLQRDGGVVGVDGMSDLKFNIPEGNYYVVVKHRNHLAIMTAATVALSSTVEIVDFTNSNNQITFGSNAQTVFGMPNNIVAMWTGNVNADTIVQYSGTTPDTPSILSEVLNDPGNFLNFPTYTISGYNMHDVNMDGNTQYTGTMPDTPFILQNVLSHPGNFLNFSTFAIIEQLPEN
ncbi:hemagglutinin protein [uncultured Kordia sp.]|uniref:hemagglutinin protein n=1 Tax=uncultured Kordia sp. TaxID=507699 RepID=UPI0026232887|nr:hemagglutinin protein [uncultured Kordia sp.]